MYLLDTNHCFHLISGHPSIVRKLGELGDTRIFTCVIVQGELIYGAYRSEKRSDNLKTIGLFLDDIEVLPIDSRTAEIYGSMKSSVFDHFGPREKAKKRKFDFRTIGINENDLWIAAVAKRNDLTIVSTDSDFGRIRGCQEIRVESWLPAK